jgi:N-dimethylarginine dimethylaminohydrolase
MWEKKILMCRPEHYAVDYEINHWMHVDNKVDNQLALDQWTHLHHLVIRCGGYVEYIEQPLNAPDMVFTANAGIVKDNKFFASTFRHSERTSEEPYWTEWFLQNGYEVSKMPKKMDLKFEGAGDCLEWGDYLIGAHGPRSSEDSSRIAGMRVGYNEKKIKEVNLVSKFYHLDTCFCPLNSEVALVYPKAFGVHPLEVVEGKIIEVSEEDAGKFACNCVIIGEHVIMPSGCEETAHKVAEHGFKVHLTDMSEFIKSGGACKCLTLELPSS